MKKKLRFLMVAGLVFAISLMALAPVYAGGRDGKDHWRDTIRLDRYPRPPRYRRHPRRGKRFTGKNTGRLLFYFLSKAISEAGRRREVVYVSPPPQPVYVVPQPTYTPVFPATIVTVKNSTNWYLSVEINGRQLSLYPGCEQVVPWTYTGRGEYVEARAYLDPHHQESVGTYQGNLVGYQIPWKLNFDYGSFG